MLVFYTMWDKDVAKQKGCKKYLLAFFWVVASNQIYPLLTDAKIQIIL